MAIRKLERSWQYDFKLPAHPRQRQGGYRTKAEARDAERQAREALLRGYRRFTLAEAHELYRAATRIKPRTADSYTYLWDTFIRASLGHLFIEQVDTAALDAFKRTLPGKWAPKTINQGLILVSAVLRFMWKRGRLGQVPYIPKESVPRKRTDWYTEQERDRLLAGMMQLQPQWYCFYYVTARLGLRLGEVYALSTPQLRDIPPRIIIDRMVQRGTKARASMVVESRKNDEAYELEVTPDVLSAIRWHLRQGYGGPEYLFSKTGEFPRYLDSHKRPLLAVQRKLGLRELSHHRVGRHSVASQAVTAGMSIRAVQAQLGHRSEQSTHRYTHLGTGAQLRLVEGLQPSSPPHVNVVSTDMKKGT